MQPWIEPPDAKEQDAIKRAKAMMARLKARSNKKVDNDGA
jgi:hypothetical protein